MLESFYCAMFGVTFFVVALSAFVGSTPTLKALEDGRIVGGFDIEITEAPYQVSLLNRGRHTCGGTIIASDMILTAAHCVRGLRPSDHQIRAGSSYHKEGGQVVQVEDILSHEDFSMSRMDYDVAVLKLEKPLKFNENITAIDMIDDGVEIEEGATAIVTGWGHLKESGGAPDNLQMVHIPTITEKECDDAYQPAYVITSRMLCAGLPDGGKDACQGDSGGPLVNNNKLAGVVSWGYGCARPNFPGVYAKVSALRKWIDDKILVLRAKSMFRKILNV